VEREGVTPHGGGGVAQVAFDTIVGAPSDGKAYHYSSRNMARNLTLIGVAEPPDDDEARRGDASDVAFGAAVAIFSSYYAVSAPLAYAGTGCVFLYRLADTLHLRTLLPSDSDNARSFGAALVASSTTFFNGFDAPLLAVGSTSRGAAGGCVYVYSPTGDATIVALVQRLAGFTDHFGFAAALTHHEEEDTSLVVSDPFSSEVWVFAWRHNTTKESPGFELTQTLAAPPESAGFGQAVALSAHSPYLAVLAGDGRTYIFHRDAKAPSAWSSSSQQLLTPGGKALAFTGRGGEYLVVAGAAPLAAVFHLASPYEPGYEWAFFTAAAGSPPPVEQSGGVVGVSLATTDADFATSGTTFGVETTDAFAFETCEDLVVDPLKPYAGRGDGYTVTAELFEYDGASVTASPDSTPEVVFASDAYGVTQRLCLRDGCYALHIPNQPLYKWRYGRTVFGQGSLAPVLFFVKQGDVVSQGACDGSFPRPSAYPTFSGEPHVTNNDGQSHDAVILLAVLASVAVLATIFGAFSLARKQRPLREVRLSINLPLVPPSASGDNDESRESSAWI